jgi:hypothetical protein
MGGVLSPAPVGEVTGGLLGLEESFLLRRGYWRRLARTGGFLSPALGREVTGGLFRRESCLLLQVERLPEAC